MIICSLWIQLVLTVKCCHLIGHENQSFLLCFGKFDTFVPHKTALSPIKVTFENVMVNDHIFSNKVNDSDFV